MIRCPQCGYDNALGHIFCIQCRSKLDLESLDDKGWNESESGQRNGLGRRLLWIVLFAGVALGVALAIWPDQHEGRKGTDADAQQARRKIMLLEKGLSPAAQIFSEREINAYFALLQRNIRQSQTQGIWTIELQSVEASIRPNAVTITTASVWGPVTVGSYRLGPWIVTSQITAVPERGSRGFQWKIRSGRIGHLPLPGAASAPATIPLRPLLGVSFRERVMLANVNRLELEEGQVAVTANNKVGQSP